MKGGENQVIVREREVRERGVPRWDRVVIFGMVGVGMWVMNHYLEKLWGPETMGVVMLVGWGFMGVVCIWCGLQVTWERAADRILQAHRQTIEGSVHQERNDSLRNVMMLHMLTRTGGGGDADMVQLMREMLVRGSSDEHHGVQIARMINDEAGRLAAEKASERPDREYAELFGMGGGASITEVE